MRNTTETNHYTTNRHSINHRRAAKKRQVLRTKICIIASFVFLITLLSVNGLKTNASTVPGNTYGETRYESVRIEKGDTLWELAYSHTDGSKKQMNYCMKEIKRINHMSRFELLKAGEAVIVPCLNE